jgi:hypothetical protein
MKRFFCLIILISAVLSVTTAEAQQMVQAEGMAAIHKNLVDIARDKAIDNAQRSAVEKVVGVMITSTTEVENFQVKMDRILSESGGFINSYKIIKQKREGDLYEVTIEADVGVGRLKDRMAAMNMIMVRKSKPRLMIFFSEQAQKDAIAEAAMAGYFLSQGFRLVDADLLRKARDIQTLQAKSVNREQITGIARQYGAEIVILGSVEVTTKSFKMGDVEVQSNEVAVSGKVINGDTGEIIASDSKIRKGDMKVVIEQAAGALAKDMKENILERWSSELTNTATVKLVVSGLKSYQELARFKEMLSVEIKGFKDIYQRSYARGKVELDLDVKGSSQSVADDMADITLNHRRIQILEISPNSVKADFQP